MNRRIFALVVGCLCHGLFLLGVGTMVAGIYFGLRIGQGPFTGVWAVIANTVLLVQFPVIHSLLLTASGSRFLRALSPQDIASDMSVTWFAAIASLQLLLVFGLWSPTEFFLVEFNGTLRLASNVLYAASWIFLLKAMVDADLSLQSGSKGWLSVWRGKKAVYRSFPESGTFRICRQPIYLAFTLILWTAPTWTLDRLALALCWTAYCYLGPRLKEGRWLRRYGERFERYRESVPYFLPFRKRNISIPGPLA